MTTLGLCVYVCTYKYINMYMKDFIYSKCGFNVVGVGLQGDSQVTVRRLHRDRYKHSFYIGMEGREGSDTSRIQST